MITIDIGNTAIKAAVFENNSLNSVFRFENMEGLWSFCSHLPFDTAIIISSVTNDTLEAYYNHFLNLIVLNHLTKVPLLNKYETPKTLGNDRLAAAVGAYTEFPNVNSLVIDAGTAIKYEFISNKGEYLGGNITAGLDMKFKALHHFTGRLPLVEKNKHFLSLGLTTETAIRNGVMFGTQMEMQGFIDYYQQQNKDLQVILTGGDHSYFVDRLKGTIFAEPNLVLKGLYHILKYNVPKV